MNAMAGGFAVITGGSSGIGLALARQFLAHRFDVLIAADRNLEAARAQLMDEFAGSHIEILEADLATEAGVAQLFEAIRNTGRPVDALCANAGIGAGQGFFDESRAAWAKVIETNVTGTLDIVHRVGRDMRAARKGRILITSSIASHTPSPFLAVYSASKAFLQSFAAAIRDELKDSGVSVTALMPGATDSGIWDRAEVTDTRLGASPAKDDPDDVAKTGYDALMRGEAAVVHGLMNKAAVAAANLIPDGVIAAVARHTSKPGSA